MSTGDPEEYRRQVSEFEDVAVGGCELDNRSFALECASRVDQGTGKAGLYVVGKAKLFERYLRGDESE